MIDDRGVGLESLRRWAHCQQTPPESFEVVVVFDSKSRKLEPQARSLLRPWDQVLYDDGTARDQYAAAVRAAKGDVLLFTEAHCVPYEGNVDRVIDAFADEGLQAAVGRTEPWWHNRMSHSEAKIWLDASGRWPDPNVWAKVNIHGFFIRSEVLERVGGFPRKYNVFAEELLAANLHSHGYTIRYLPEVAVLHHEAGHLRFHEESVGRYVWSECRYRLGSDSPEFVREYFGEHIEWIEALEMRTATATAIGRSLLERVLDDSEWRISPISRSEAARELMVWCARRTVGPWWMLATAQVKRIRALRRVLAARSLDAQTDALREFRELTAQTYRRVFALLHGASVPAKLSSGNGRLTLARLDGRSVAGFFPSERLDGRAFRWSGTVAGIRLTFPEAAVTGYVHLMPLRRLEPNSDAALYLNGVQVPLQQESTDCWSFPVLGSGGPLKRLSDGWLVLHVRVWEEAQRNGETRGLGLPIEAISFTCS